MSRQNTTIAVESPRSRSSGSSDGLAWSAVVATYAAPGAAGAVVVGLAVGVA